MLHHILPVLGGFHTVHALDLLCCRLYHVRLTYRHLICVWQWILVPERIEQILLLAQALRQALLRFLSADVFYRLDALEGLDLCTEFLLRILAQTILHIDADLHLRLKHRCRTVHIEGKDKEHAEDKKRDSDRTDRRKCHPVVAAQRAQNFLHIVLRRPNLHIRTPRAAHRARSCRPQWRQHGAASYRQCSYRALP